MKYIKSFIVLLSGVVSSAELKYATDKIYKFEEIEDEPKMCHFGDCCEDAPCEPFDGEETKCGIQIL